MKLIFIATILLITIQFSYQCQHLWYNCNGTCLPPWAGPCNQVEQQQQKEIQKVNIIQEQTEATECCGPVRPSPVINTCPALRYACNGGCVPAWEACPSSSSSTSNSTVTFGHCPVAQAPCGTGCIPIWARCQSSTQNK